MTAHRTNDPAMPSVWSSAFGLSASRCESVNPELRTSERARWSIAGLARGMVIAAFAACLAIPVSGARPEDSPRDALKSLYLAIEAGNTADVRKLLAASNEADERLVDAFARQIVAARNFAEAMKLKFGETPGDIDALTRGISAREMIARLADAKQTVEGDRATLTVPGQKRPLNLVKSSGRWQIIVQDFAGATPQDAALQAQVLLELAEVFQSVAADVNSEKLGNAQEAQKVLAQKLQLVIVNTLSKQPPATRPITQPATRPG